MAKEINMEWMQDLLANDKHDKKDLPEIDWVRNGSSFRRDLKFKVVPANSKENNIHASIVGTHWNLGPNKDVRFVCPEQSMHLKKLGVKCPVCEAKRQLLAAGFKEDDLTIQGKFGKVSVFDPVLTTNVKVVVTGSDLRSDWDASHISILQQKGTFLAEWLVKKVLDNETPDFLNWEVSNILHFSRPTDNGKWNREVSFTNFTPSPETLAKLKEENENLTLKDLWKMPTDEEFLMVTQVVKEMVDGFKKAREALSNPSIVESNMPF